MSVERDLTAKQIRGAGLRATEARLAVLRILADTAKPMTVADIIRRTRIDADQATVYRVLASLAGANLVRRVLSPEGGAAQYEIASLPHHHHLTCEKCGRVEDVEGCMVRGTPASTLFVEVTGHQLEFSGVCKRCA